MFKYFSHACLVLFPKIDHLNKLLEFRPISLSNITNKGNTVKRLKVDLMDQNAYMTSYAEKLTQDTQQ